MGSPTQTKLVSYTIEAIPWMINMTTHHASLQSMGEGVHEVVSARKEVFSPPTW